MTPAETITILRLYNEWRQGGFDLPQPDPNQITAAIDAAVEMIERLEAAEKERDTLRTAVRHESDCVEAAKAEIKALRARIEAMEQQVPICRAEDLRHAEILLPSLGLMPEDKLYALPGTQAQPAPNINEGVRKVTIGFRREGEAQHHIPTIKIEFDPVSPYSPNDAKGWQDRDRIASMLSPEAKP